MFDALATRCLICARISLSLKSLLLGLTNSMEQSPSWEANRSSDSQEIPRVIWNLKVHYRIHKSPPPVPILSHINPVHAPHPTSWRSILILSSHLRLGLPNGLLPSSLSTKILYVPLPSPYVLHAPPTSFFLGLTPEHMTGFNLLLVLLT